MGRGNNLLAADQFSDILGSKRGAERPITAASIIEDNLYPGRIWQGKEDAANAKVQVLDVRRDGRIILKRLTGPAASNEITVTQDQLTAAFEPANIDNL